MSSTESPTIMTPMSQNELDVVIKKHKMYLEGDTGGARAVVKFRNLSGLTLKGKNLSHADFTGSCFIGSDLSHSDFTSTTFFACDMRRANLEESKFIRADFRGAFVAGANLKNADLKSADLREGKIMEKGTAGYLSDRLKRDESMPVAQTIFAGARLMQTNLSGIRAASADFSDADMSNVKIQGADLRNANLTGANLTKSDLTGTDIRGADLKDAIIKNAIMTLTEVAGANLDETINEDPTGAEIDDLEHTFEELLQEHTNWISTSGAEGKQLDLSGFDLRMFEGLGNHTLTAMKAIGANFLDHDFSGAEIQSATLDESDFRDCKFVKTDLRGSSFRSARLSRCDFTRANMAPLLFKAANGEKRARPINMEGASLRYSVFHRAHMVAATLKNADLSYADFTGADLRKADLRGAKLDGIVLKDANLDDAKLDDGVEFL